MTANHGNGPTEPEAPPPEEKPSRPLKRRVLRWTAIGLGGLVGLLLLILLLGYTRGRSAVGERYDITPPTVSVPTDSATIARGEHIARIHACHHCHGERLEGQVMADVAPALIAPPNLTRGTGGVGSRYAAVDWDRAVRYGVRPDGSPLLPMMPYQAYNRLNDADMAALSAYLASRPAVDNQVPATRLKTFGYIMFGFSGLPRDGLDRPRSIIEPGATPEYGSYLASTTCTACHGERLQGQTGGHEPAPGLHGYATADWSMLVRALREGVAADGRELDSDLMPWPAFRHMHDFEIAALHAYLATLARRD